MENAAISLALGVLGWIVAQLIGRPVIKFFEARSLAIEAIYFSANVGFIESEIDKPRRERAHDELRRCAARFEALRHNTVRPTRAIIEFMGYDLEKAVKGLTGLSNTLGQEEGSSRAFQIATAEQALGLTPSYTKEELEQMRNTERQRRPRF